MRVKDGEEEEEGVAAVEDAPDQPGVLCLLIFILMFLN
jgi:hypothetical protein